MTNLEIKIFDLSDKNTFLEKLKQMTKFHEAIINNKKTSNIFITKNTRQIYNQKPHQDIKVITLKDKGFDINYLKNIIENNQEPVLINWKSGKWAFYESTNHLDHIYIGEQAKNQDNPYIRIVHGKE